MIRCKYRSNAKKSRAKQKSEDQHNRNLGRMSFARAPTVSPIVEDFEQCYTPRPKQVIEVWRRNDG